MGRTTEGGRNIFEAAATFGFRGVKYFVENKKVPVTSTNADNRTAAHIAAREGKLEVVKYLLGKNSSLLHAVDNFGYTMYHLAVINGALNVIKYLLDECKVDINLPNEIYDQNRPIHMAAESGQVRVFRYFVEKRDIDVNLLNGRGQPPAFLAAKNRQKKIIKYIIEVQVNLDGIMAKDYDGRTILFMAAFAGDISVPKLLTTIYRLELDVNAQDKTGTTVTHLAAKHDHFDLLKYLVSWKGADVTVANNDGTTPLHEAAKEGHLYITKFLIERGANKSAHDKYGKSPRDYALGDDELLACFKKLTKKRSRREVSYFVQPEQVATTSYWYSLFGERLQSLEVWAVDRSLSGHFSYCSRVSTALTLANGLVRYFVNDRRNVPAFEFSPKTVLHGKIDSLALDAVYADSVFRN